MYLIKKLIFKGWKTEEGEADVFVESVETGLSAKLPLYLDEANHTSEFNWGYPGSGPAQLAYSILRFYFENIEGVSIEASIRKAIALHMRFKFDVISKLHPDEEWAIAPEYIEKWREGLQNERI